MIKYKLFRCRIAFLTKLRKNRFNYFIENYKYNYLIILFLNLRLISLSSCYGNEAVTRKGINLIQLNNNFCSCKQESLSSLLSFHSFSKKKEGMECHKHFPNLQKIGVLNNNNIIIQNKEKVEEILSALLRESFDNLQLVVDFDYTLTRGHFNGEKSLCSWGILDNSHRMPPFYREKSSQLLSKYYPIEIDATISEIDKIPHMVEWYQSIIELLKSCHLNRETMREMVSESNVKFRDETESLFKKLKDEEVPILIFSAGMGDILEHVLWHFDVYSENVKVVSNFFKYNDEGYVTGFKSDLIHMFNKNENAIHSSQYFNQLKQRKNVILMGDSLGDVKMAVGVPESSNVLKIGFFNHNMVGDRINLYTDAYDIVLVNDQTMSVANSILAHIKR